MQKMRSQPAHNYNEKQNQGTLLELLSDVFPNQKQRSKLTMIRECVFGIPKGYKSSKVGRQKYVPCQTCSTDVSNQDGAGMACMSRLQLNDLSE